MAQRLLVVEDNADLQEILADFLGMRWAVECVGSAEGALERLRGSGPAIDLLLCDVALPGMSGLQLFDEISRLRLDYEVRVLFATGGSPDPAVSASLNATGAAVLHKPFKLAELAALVERELMRLAP